MNTPTFMELIGGYREAAELERIKFERPSRRTVQNVLSGLRTICRILFPTEDWPSLPMTALTRREMDRFLLCARRQGLSGLSAWSALQSLKGLTARWTLDYYAERGWRVKPFALPVCRLRTERYRRPDRKVLLKVKAWYDGLWIREDKRDWLVVTLMLEFALRNGDVARLTWDGFHEREHAFLTYMPHKTAQSSGRVVVWPVHAELWARFKLLRSEGGERVVPHAQEVFSRLNAELRRERFFTGAKALYELRKICVDHVYQKFGAEMASSISGDDIRTVTHYYADPSSPNLQNVRIVDLL